jgi:glycerate 2-kinase
VGTNDQGSTWLMDANARAVALDLVHEALSAVDPAARLREQVRRVENVLLVGDSAYNLDEFERVYVLGAGKATYGMAVALEAVLGDRLTDGFIVVKHGQVHSLRDRFGPIRTCRFVEAGHPVPDKNSLDAGREVLRMAQLATERDLVICLMTGGISALCVAPIDSVSFDDKLQLYKLLVHSGADTTEMMTVRGHLSKLKAGGLLQVLPESTVIGLCVSDERYDDIRWCSTWTMRDGSTPADAVRILHEYRLWDKVPSSIRDALDEPVAASCPLPRVENRMITRTRDLWRPIAHAATGMGLRPVLLTTVLSGESRYAGSVIASVAVEAALSGQPVEPPCVLVALGETTVRVDDPGSGRGGPNQELAVGASLVLADLIGSARIALCALDTDGTDGPTDVAGAIVDADSVHRARDMGVDLRLALRDHDVTSALITIGDAVMTGHTGTNTNDLVVAVVLDRV